MHVDTLIQDLGIVLAVAAVMGVLARMLRLPPVLGYLFAGLVVGPYIPIPVFADPHRTHEMSELGIVLVMFVVGLELRLRRLIAVLPTAGATAVIEVAAVALAGFFLGRLFGWDMLGSVFLGASLAISSTMIVSNVFGGLSVERGLRDHVMSVLVVQDVLAIVLAAVLTAIAAGSGLAALDLGFVLGKLGLVLLVGTVLGVLVVPRIVRWVVALGSRELIVVLCVGLCFAMAMTADLLGYSVALGAFLAGVLVAESGEGHDVEHLMQPVRDVFAAIFFVSIGMEVDPVEALTYAPVALAAFAVVVLTQFFSVSLAGILSGMGTRRSVRAGLTLGQVGEFGFILAAIGTEAGLAPAGLAPVVVTVAVLTAFTTPLAIRGSEQVAQWLDHATPRRLQELLSLYEGLLEAVRRPIASPRGARGPWRLLAVLLAELALIAALLLAVTLGRTWLAGLVEQQVGVGAPWSTVVVVVAAALLLGLPAWAFWSASKAFADSLADRLLDDADGPGPRVRAVLVRAVQALVLVAAALPLAVVVGPLIDGWAALPVLALIVLSVALVARAVGRAGGEARTSAQRVLDLMAGQMADEADPGSSTELPILASGAMETLVLSDGAYAIGHTLRDLDLRARTGSTVLAIRPSDGPAPEVLVRHRLGVGDSLVLAGPPEALVAGRGLLSTGHAER